MIGFSGMPGSPGAGRGGCGGMPPGSGRGISARMRVAFMAGSYPGGVAVPRLRFATLGMTGEVDRFAPCSLDYASRVRGRAGWWSLDYASLRSG